MNIQIANSYQSHAIAEKTRSEFLGSPPSVTLFHPGNLLDSLTKILGLKNDAALARALEVSAPVLSKIRHRTLAVSGAVLIRMQEVSDLSISDLRFLMNDLSPRFRPGIK